MTSSLRQRMPDMTEASDYRRRLGRRIENGRIRQGWSREQLAGHLSVSSVVLRRIEEGLTSLPAADLVKIARRLDLSLHELLEEPVLEAQPGADRLAAAWSLIERPQDRKAVLAFVQALAEKDR